MAKCRYKRAGGRNFGQCKCRWCDRYGAGTVGSVTCPVTDEMRAALKLFAHGNGRTWKSKLNDEWQTGGYGIAEDIRGPLMGLRNVIGPSGLLKIPTHLVDDVVIKKGGA